MAASANLLPPARPVLWPLRKQETADVSFAHLEDGRRHIVIRHAALKGVSAEMLAWWYGHIIGDMDYAGGRWPRYLVWHPLDHISYEMVRPSVTGGIGPGARLHIREAFQRNPANLLDVSVTVERIGRDAAIIGNRVFGLSALRLINEFQDAPAGASYVTDLTIGDPGAIGRLVFNRLIGSRILPGAQAQHWIRHHIEEVGNLENFLPQLYRAET
jgi:hypothetical protein